eukprot:CAMPEP_0172489680 /NCGR_PEP_ID=MMETSP1066-20121228/19853_1 /TAXON_ID=671091 /ORGANISM="Coscinodiscus wailesii, Strain CCMP2513" /LENGTH=435 /DNA_ID=CAMNT_0013257725 /DNA_START=28 /DNA_END=1332 /DNA_ORIENTATION=-
MILGKGRRHSIVYLLSVSSIAATTGCGGNLLGVLCFAVVPNQQQHSINISANRAGARQRRGGNGGGAIATTPMTSVPSFHKKDEASKCHYSSSSSASYLCSTSGNSLASSGDENSSSSSSSNEISRGGDVATAIGRWPCGDELDKRISKIAVPCIANFAINPLVGAVDLFWVGRMGNALAIAGQAAANQVFNSAFWLISYLPSVTATLVSKEYANNDQDGVQDAVCQAFFVGVSLAVFGTAFLLLKPDVVLRTVLTDGAPALEFARPYLMIRAFAFLPALVSNIGYSAFRGILDTVTPLKISMSANIFNAIFDPFLIFTMSMGVSGAAIATLTAELISSIIYMREMFTRKIIRWSKLFRVPQWHRLAPLLKGGAALQLRNLALNIAFLSVARVTQGIDETGVAAAAHSIAIQVFQVGGIVLLALSTVAQTLVPNE